MGLPKFFKDGAGYCYTATERLAKVPSLVPWDGSVDAQGFAVEGGTAAPAKKSEREPAAKPGRAVKRKPAQEPASVDAVLGNLTDLG